MGDPFHLVRNKREMQKVHWLSSNFALYGLTTYQFPTQVVDGHAWGMMKAPVSGQVEWLDGWDRACGPEHQRCVA
jgi:hypothetical protein